MKSLLLVVLSLLGLSWSATAQPASGPTRYGQNAQAGKYAKVNGLNLYYEVYGTGQPLLLLHGNGGSIAGQTSRIERFKGKYRVIAVDNRGQGNSKDDTSVLTYELMASDVAKLLDQLKIDSCYVFGQSDGGIIGLLLAKDYPRKVKRLAVFGANLEPDSSAIAPPIRTMIQDTARLARKTKTKQLYALMSNHPHIAPPALAGVRAPVLVMSGDRDAIRLEHTLQIFAYLPQANLFVMPGASHFGSWEKRELFFAVLTDFFEKPFNMPSTATIMGLKEK
jgi:pimeloyl-ACP methyl ester carboxylesterase